MVSEAYEAQEVHKLTYTAPRVQAKNPDGSLKYDAAGQRVWEPGGGQPQTLDVHLTPEGRGAEGERPGANVNEVYYEGQVVKTPGSKPLELPVGIREFPFSVGGVAGTLRIRPVVVAQHPEEVASLGREFRAVWSA